jgi:hypothetical protein
MNYWLICVAACDSHDLQEALFGNALVAETGFSEIMVLDKPQSARLNEQC